MNKEIEQLKKYRYKISSLTKEEKLLREEHLSKLASGEIQGPLTNYSSIDKPWLKYHTGFYEEAKIKKTVYQELHDNNIDQPKTTAIEFFGSKISFGKLDREIDKTSKSLKSYGVKKGDFVTIISAGVPETVYSFYALSKIGAVANLMAPYFDEEGLINRIKECNSEILIIMDTFYESIKDRIAKTNIKKIIIVPTLNSCILGLFQKKYKVDNKKEVLWNQFIKNGENEKIPETVDYEPKMPLAMVYSSGTTGASKGILLSNDSFQNSVYAYRKSGVEVGRGFKFYQIIPPWYSTGLSTSINLPLTSGSSVFMDPRFERDIFIKNIIKYKPNYSVAPTSMYEGFLDDKLVKNADLSSLKYPFEGGEPLNKEVATKIEKVFREHNNNSNLLVGYGQCECGATITSESQYTNHKDGNVGIPLPGINIMIIDSEFNPLRNNKRGQILVDTKSGMLGYYKNEKANSEYFYTDEQGTIWNCTGDIGYVDNDGNLFIEGRASDVSYVNSKKVYNFDIEKAIMKDKNVKLCDVISVNNQIIAHIVFNEDFIATTNNEQQYFELYNIRQLIADKIKDEDLIPHVFKIRKDFPYAKSGKRDIKAMREETDGFIILDNEKKKEKKLQK